LYSPNKDANSSFTQHIDQGLVLLFTPGQQHGAATSGFFIQLQDGSTVEVAFDEAVDDLVIMLGDGIDQYFNPILEREERGRQRLRAVPHALTLPETTASEPRLWYGRMVLPPAAALFHSATDRHPQEETTFGDVWEAMIRGDEAALNLGCASERMVARDVHVNTFLSEGSNLYPGVQSLIGHVDDPNECDPDFSIHCWMRCMAYNNTSYNPDNVTVDSCEAEGEELMCAKDNTIWTNGVHDHGYGIKCGDHDLMEEATLRPTKSPTKASTSPVAAPVRESPTPSAKDPGENGTERTVKEGFVFAMVGSIAAGLFL
jgi:hypothetical protein